jgi:hypothetical protein
VNVLLKNCGMEEHEAISEIRHAATHKVLPDPLIVKKSLEYILVFLFEKFWLPHFSLCVK